MTEEYVEFSRFPVAIGGEENEIDIDIDLSTGQNDEDYILEDIPSDTGTDQAIVNNDDLMVDEENPQYLMDDVDLAHEEHPENLQMADADLSDVPTSEFHIPNLVGDSVMGRALFAAENNDISEATMDDPHAFPTAPRDGEDDIVKQNQDDLNMPVTGNSVEAQEPAFPSALSSRGDIEDRNSSIEAETSAIRQNSSSRSNSGSPRQHSPDNILDSHIAQPAARDHTDTEQEVPAGENEALTRSRVVVVYRDVEYALICASDEDDLDSFFLKDDELIMAPFAKFLAALRNIVLDDLAPDEELCLCIDDLGLEISETCMSVEEVNFASIIDLYDTLIRNDGMEPPGPLYVSLGTKPDFRKRLANLTSGAAAGKGLSELVTWDEGSENWDRDDESLQPGNAIQVPLNGNDHEVELGGFKTVNQAQSAHQTAVEGNVEEVAAQEQEELREANGTQKEQLKDDVKGLGTSKVPVTTEAPYLGSVEAGERIGHAINGHDTLSRAAGSIGDENDEHDEDGDLIDYEDEEYQQDRDASATSLSTTQPDIGDPQDEINEESHRRSATRSADQHESHSIDQAKHHVLADQTSTGHESDDSVHHTSYETTAEHDLKDYEEDFADYDEQEEQEYGHEEVTINSNVLHGDTIRSPLEHATYGGEEGQTTLSADTIAADSEYLNEDDFADEFENHPTPENDLDEQTHYDSGSRGEANPHFAGPNATFDVTDPEFENLVRNNEDADLDEINYDEGEDQESKHSEHTLLGDDTTQDLEVDGIAQTQGDEIDYDEDDAEPVSPPVPKGSLDDTVIWNAQPSKRSRADTEDTTDRRSKETKRSKS